MGIEVEVERAGSLDGARLDWWSIVPDSSLRNEGRELVSTKPVPYANVDDAIEEFRDVVTANPNLEVSTRCGVHVHVNVRDLTPKQVGNILLTYVAVEAVMYNFGGKERYSNIYCPGITAAADQIHNMKRALKNTDEFIHACHDWCKYTGINLRTVPSLGTVEFRAHEGTLSADNLADWAKVIKRLVDYAVSVPDSRAILNDMSKGADHMAEAVFGDMARAALDDGVYAQYFNNNLLNVLDLLSDGKDYKAARAKAAVPEDNPSLQSVIDEVQAILGRA